MSLAKRIQEARERAGLTLDELAKKAGISKTYLWELENDTKGEKKPSADVLLKLANALSTTIANLMGLPEVQVDHTKVPLPSSLVAFRDWMKSIGEKVTDHDLRDLATMRFRGGQPRTKEDWFDLYRLLKRTSEE
ncbi:MAG: helix-turn-helix domain-containing protein [Phycisphaerales bacterium]